MTEHITFNGGNPREVQEFVRERLGPGHLFYIWGGTEKWIVTLHGHGRINYSDTLTWNGEQITVEEPND